MITIIYQYEMWVIQLCQKLVTQPLWKNKIYNTRGGIPDNFGHGVVVLSVGHGLVRADDVVVRRKSDCPSRSTWTLLLVQAFFTAIVNSYLDSKTLLSRTIMDRANKLLYILLLLFALITSVVCTLFYLFSDSGHVLSLVAGWPFVYLAHTTILELVLNTLIQLVLIRHIKF